MSIYQNIKADLALALTTAVGSTVTESDFNILGVRAATAEEVTTYGTNSKVSIAATDASTVIQGNVSLYFNRLDLASLTKLSYYNSNGLLYPGVGGSDVSIYTLLATLKAYLGVNLSVDDLVETFTTTGSTNVSLAITAKPTSPGWIGTTTVKFALPATLSDAYASDYLTDF